MSSCHRDRNVSGDVDHEGPPRDEINLWKLGTAGNCASEQAVRLPLSVDRTVDKKRLAYWR